MKRFLGIYTGTQASAQQSGWNELSDGERKKREEAGMAAWMAWGTEHAGAIVDQGAPLGKTKRAGRDGISDIKNNMTGYVVVQAESHDAAVRLFERHPHFTIFPGEAVEVMELLPLPSR